MAAMHEQRFRFEPVAHEAAITAAFDREGAHVVSSRKFGRADWRSVTRQSRKAEYAALFRPARADPGQPADRHRRAGRGGGGDQGRSEEHTSELQSLMRSSYDVFRLKEKTTQ